MKRWKSIEDFRGPRDDFELDPTAMQFTTKAAPRGCKGCVFDGQWARICTIAVDAAQRAGLGHCEQDKMIYVRCETDPRQFDLIGEVHENE